MLSLKVERGPLNICSEAKLGQKRKDKPPLQLSWLELHLASWSIVELALPSLSPRSEEAHFHADSYVSSPL
jgi:hypothetical protein